MTPNDLQVKHLAMTAKQLWARTCGYEKGVRKEHSADQLNHHCSIALFLAQQELPEGSEDDQRRRALSILRQDLIGKGTTYEHVNKLEVVRQAPLDHQRWSAWGDETLEDEGFLADPCGPLDLQTIQDELLEDLAGSLTPKDYRLLVDLYILGRTREELVEEAVAEDPTYDTPEGRKQVDVRLRVATHRARKRAASLLPERWRTYAEDVAA